MIEHKKEIWFELSVLISKNLSENVTNEEQLKLDEWKNESQQNRELFERICSDEVMREKIKLYRGNGVQAAFESFVKRRERKSSRRWVLSVARYAAIILFPLLIVFVYFSWDRSEKETFTASGGESMAKKNMPVLTLSNGQEMSLYDQNLLLQEENGVQITVKPEGGIEYSAPVSDQTALVYNTLTTPSQCDFTFTLADGTKVWLNAKSSLRYPVTFTGKERTVYAEGEIYLEVAKDREHPFFVVLDGMKIEVVGTSFNINSYADESFTEVTLVEGCVAAHVEDKSYDLLPSRQLRWNKEDHIVDIKTVNANDYIAWKSGKYIFKGRMLSEVAKVLQRWYEMEIVFEREACSNFVYTGVIYKEESFDVFVQRLEETSSLSCRLEGHRLYVK